MQVKMPENMKGLLGSGGSYKGVSCVARFCYTSLYQSCIYQLVCDK
jgi:hypothetical protein